MRNDLQSHDATSRETKWLEHDGGNKEAASPASILIRLTTFLFRYLAHDTSSSLGTLQLAFAATPFLPIMSLALSIFLLVFITELIQWIGQSVILELVSYCIILYVCLFGAKFLRTPIPPGLLTLFAHIQLLKSRRAA